MPKSKHSAPLQDQVLVKGQPRPPHVLRGLAGGERIPSLFMIEKGGLTGFGRVLDLGVLYRRTELEREKKKSFFPLPQFGLLQAVIKWCLLHKALWQPQK